MIPLMFLLGQQASTIITPNPLPYWIGCNNIEKSAPSGYNCVSDQSYNGIQIGDMFEGGYYAGKYLLYEQIYAIVVSPKNAGEYSGYLCTSSIVPTNIALDSMEDGYTNTINMYNYSKFFFPAAKIAVEKNINGYTDWYIPSPYELFLLERNLYPYTTNNNSVITTNCSDNNIENSGVFTRYVGGYNPNSYPCVRYTYTLGDPLTQTSSSLFKSTGTEKFTSSPYGTSYVSKSSKSVGHFIGNPSGYDYGGTGTYNTVAWDSTRVFRLIRKVPI